MANPFDKFDEVNPFDKFDAVDAPKAEKPNMRGVGFNKAMAYNGADAVGGAIRGAGSIGASLLRLLPNFLGGDTAQENEQRRTSMDEGLTSLIGSNPDSMGYKTTKLGAEIAGTLGVGPALGAGATTVGLGRAATALASGGMTTGVNVAPGAGAWLGNQALRAGAGGISGGAMAGLVEPADIGSGAAIGAIAPGAFQLAGRLGGADYQSIKGGKSSAGKQLAAQNLWLQ